MMILLVILSLASAQLRHNVTELDSPVEQLVWCGASVVVTNDDETIYQDDNESATHRKVVFVLTKNGMLYRSTDYGFRWQNITQRFQNETLNSNYVTTEMHQSPADSKVIFFIGKEGSSFKTDTCGMHFQAITHHAKLKNFKLNKMNARWLFAMEERNCQRGDRLCKDKYRKVIHLSEDYGYNWRVILERVREASWDKLLEMVMIPDQRILVSHLSSNGSIAISYSDDYFKSVKTIRYNAFSFYQTTSYLFLLIKADPNSEGYDIEYAPAIPEYMAPQEILFPVDDYTKYTFTVLDTSSGQIFISVSHDEDLPKVTNVYMSNLEGKDYALSLVGNVRSQDTGNCDFEKIESLEGVYLSNVYDPKEVQKAVQRKRKITSDHERKVQPAEFKLEQYIKTQISYDKGSSWHSVKAPKYNFQGQALNCGGDCSLHLKGRVEGSNIYSTANAVGIILAVGNTGLYLSQKDEDHNTYLSRDGGQNWFEVLRGSYQYEIGDHGGLIVFAQDDRLTSHLLYSWDEGLTLEKLDFEKSIEVDNILTEPSNMEQKFIAIGRSQDMKGVVVAVDFVSLHTRVCTGQWDISSPESDYEYWLPMNFLGDKCILGQKYKYIRRKRNAKCFNPEDTEKRQVIEQCKCTDIDWECDIGFHRKIDKCEPQTLSFGSYKQTKPANCQGTYLKSQGYRKIPGDQCEGGLYLGPIEVPCDEDDESVEQRKEEATRPQDNTNVKTVKDVKVDVDDMRIQKEKQKQKQQQEFVVKEDTKRITDYWWVVFIILCVVFYFLKDSLFGQEQGVKKKRYYPLSEEELEERRGKTKLGLVQEEEEI